MNRSRHLVVVFCLSLCGAVTPSVGRAQTTAAVTGSTSFRGMNANQTTTLSPGDQLSTMGIIQEVICTHQPGSPAGLRVLLTGPQGLIDASVGPYLTADVRQSLAVGQPIAVAGVVATFNGHDYLLVRQLTIGDRQISIRNEKGFLIHLASTRAVHNTITNGDNQ